ncbi:MAG TPA: alpha/beta fold hydrolase [Dehalococcoidia bacterium]|nr:alpha/beta fold hydrolase [Dehalococcoidia bacterium]
MATARVNGIEMYYEVHGPDGPAEPLALIMGLGANTTGWDHQIPELSREYLVIAFDNRGSGRTEKPKEPYTVPQMADDAVALLDALGIGRAHVYGMSMGGMIAQEVALRHAARVRTLVLGGTMAGGPNAVMAGPQRLQQWASTATLPLDRAVEAGLRFLYSPEFIAANREWLVRRNLETAHLMPPVDALQRQFMAVVQFNTYERLHQIAAPTLIITGTEDQVVPAENARILAERIPGAQLLELAGAGHGFLVEKAAEANAAVLGFLRQYRASSGSPK